MGFHEMRDGLCRLPNEKYEIDHFGGPMYAVLRMLKSQVPIPDCCMIKLAAVLLEPMDIDVPYYRRPSSSCRLPRYSQNNGGVRHLLPLLLPEI